MQTNSKLCLTASYSFQDDCHCWTCGENITKAFSETTEPKLFINDHCKVTQKVLCLCQLKNQDGPPETIFQDSTL